MNNDLKIVTELPLNKLWNEDGTVDAERKRYLTKNELTEMLKQYPVEFVKANIGNELNWVPIEKCFENWKSNIKNNLADNPDKVDLESFANGFVYVASEWEGKIQTPVVLLEKCH